MKIYFLGLVAAAVLALAAGCATRPPETSSSGVDTGVIVGEVGDPRNRARIHTELAAAYYSRGSMAVALEELRTAAAADPTYAATYSMFGLVYMELRETKLAQQNFEHGLKLSPNDPDINHNYGWFLCQTGHETESIRYFLRAIGNPLYPTPWRSYTAAGVCSLRKDKFGDAEQFFERALRLRPNEPMALLQMGEIRYRAGKMSEARKYVSRFNSVVSPTAESLWLELRVERKLGQRVAEAKLASQLRRRFPGSRESQALQRGDYE
ncbi:MAG TPA: type IV pilus biogenesis/stability protein PilW [Burkholderiales bacterium]|nr:type IV pilus biogenesis/stability protein PilW [Burkholderiales bacterium]